MGGILHFVMADILHFLFHDDSSPTFRWTTLKLDTASLSIA